MIIETLPLFRPLQQKLIDMLKSLDHADWGRRTLAREWTVKDVAAHLLDTTLRTISLERDRWPLPPESVANYQELIQYLNRLNGEWVVALRRVSPAVIIQWLDESHEPYIRCLEQLEPRAPARYSVAWAGEEKSPNWFHIAREYTEKWHHQQQIREATGRQGILTRQFYHPVLETFLLALPYTYREVEASLGTRVSIHIDGDAGGDWILQRSVSGWIFSDQPHDPVDAKITLDDSVAWKLFTKGVRPEEVRDRITSWGDESLVVPILRMIAVIA